VTGNGQNERVSRPGDDGQRRIGGRYRLAGRIGAGAMGTVWSGYDEILQRRVAVKELKVPLGIPDRESLDLRERMLREARALGGLSHPNVITVYDVVVADGEPMVVLEMVPSRNLATMIAEQGVLSVPQAAVVGFATAAALRAAHRAGITHRDVKPGNVLVAHDGRVKLTDFGIARNVADAPMTTAGLVLGSPAYIAPEVAAGHAVTPAADLWGLGATLFAAIEGRPPYDVRGDPVSTITEVVDGAVPRPSSAGPVTEVIAALMVKDPTQRMPLDEVRQRLRPLISDPDDPLYPGSPDAPTMAAAITTPRPPRPDVAARPPAAPGPLTATGLRAPVGSAPLAQDPGPLPSPARAPVASPSWAGAPHPRPAPAPRRASGVAAVGLVIAGAMIVVAGAAGGWAVTRALAGQPVLSTATVTTAATDLRQHRDPLGFTIAVPADWSEYRETTGDGIPAVSFLNADGTEELTVAQVPSAEAVIDALTPALLGVDSVTVGPTRAAGAGARELIYRTETGERRSTTWLRLVPAEEAAWAVRLTMPRGRAESSGAELFRVLAGGFRTAPG
jgi:serine/threonine protein kinase